MLKEFRNFAMRGNVIDLAVGFILGAAFTTIVQSLVKDIIMPPIGLLLGGTDFANLYVVLEEGDPVGPYPSLADAQAAGAVSINYGIFINAVISFIIVAFVLFLLIRWINKAKEAQAKPAPTAEPTTKACPFCISTIAIQATRCPQCTAELQPA